MMGRVAKRRFRDLSPRNRALLVALAAVQVSLNIAAQVDITRRPDSGIRGSKLRWRLVSFVNVLGPLAYFRWGRLPAQAAPE
jgi:hypothetical protein